MQTRWFLTIAMLIAASVLLGPWIGPRLGAAAQDYGGQGMGTSTLAFDPGALAVEPGKTATAKVAVKLSSGKTWGTALQATAIPAGVTVRFDPASGDPPFASTMTVTAASTAKPGEYSIKVQATGDDPSSVVMYRVTVSKASSGY
jgi:hypothetical protein